MGWWLALVLLALVLLWALGSGQFALAPAQLAEALWARATGAASPLPPAAETVLWNIRLPRIAAGMAVGAMLAAAGAAYQGMFRNPLVSPDILGVSAGAGLGAVVAIYLGLSMFAVQWLAFGGGLVAVAVVVAISACVRRHDPVLVLVLAGIALGALLGAGIALIKTLADPNTQLPSITFWLMGGLSAVTLQEVAATAPVMLAALLPLLLLRWRINLLALPDEEARALGVPVGGCAWCWWFAPRWARRRPCRWPASSAGSGWWCRMWRACWSALISCACCRLRPCWARALWWLPIRWPAPWRVSSCRWAF
jgi:iron complex transport system permease protein